MKVMHINHSDAIGGAARAAFRIHESVKRAGIDSSMWVKKKVTDDPFVHGPANDIDRFLSMAKTGASRKITKLFKLENPALHSLALFSSGLARKINNSDADLINLHWINGETLSIGDVAAINKPLVWTLHDMWAFCGAEHVAYDFRWRDGYTPVNRTLIGGGFDINKWVWRRKFKAWKKPIQIIAPSNWLSKCVSESALMSEWPVKVIPNPIDFNSWCPIDKSLARLVLGLPQSRKLLLFGAIGGSADHNKGFDLLVDSLNCLKARGGDIELLVIGQSEPPQNKNLGFPAKYFGHLYDDISLRLLFSAADAVAIPSRCENLPNMAVEAMACGAPLISFNVGGLPDLISHKDDGFLAKAFDPIDFADGITKTIDKFYQREGLRSEVRERCISKYSFDVVSAAYLSVYENVLSSCRN